MGVRKTTVMGKKGREGSTHHITLYIHVRALQACTCTHMHVHTHMKNVHVIASV